MAIVEETVRIAEAMPDYDIERELGRGGMGVVFLGRHRRLQRGAAIKELPPSFSGEPEVQERFTTEARTLAGLAHPHIVPIFDYVERDGLCLIVMQELPGGSVWDRFTTEGLTPPTACAVVMACCAALQHAHDKGVLHLDVKPDNLMFDAESAVKVTDFGIARVITGGRTMGTVDGQVLGTPAYMSPEQARGDDLTAASDVYAAGVMLYELLCGELPWRGAETAAELLAQRLDEDPIPIRDVNPAVPGPLAVVAMKAIEREVADRYERAEDFGVAIGQACAEAWGPGWIDHAGVAIIGSERLSIAARTTGHHPALDLASAATVGGTEAAGAPDHAAARATGGGPAGAQETAARGVAPVAKAASETGTARPAAPETGAVPPAARATGAGSAPAPATGAVPPAPRARETTANPPPAPATEGTTPAAPPPSDFEAILAAGTSPRLLGVDLADLELADLVGVEDVLDPPRTPWRALITTALLFGVALVIAVVGLGEPDRDGALVAGQVELEGVDVAGGERIEVDLATGVTVQVNDDALASAADEVELEFSYLGASVGAASAPLRDGQAVIDAGLTQRTVSGASTATVRLEARDAVVARMDTPVHATQSPLLTAPFVLGMLLVLLAYADLETSLKPLRSGRTRIRSYLGAALWSPVAAVGVVLVATALGFAEPTVPGTAAVAALSALGGVAAVRSRIGVARRRRVRIAVERAEKRLGAGVQPASR